MSICRAILSCSFRRLTYGTKKATSCWLCCLLAVLFAVFNTSYEVYEYAQLPGTRYILHRPIIIDEI